MAETRESTTEEQLEMANGCLAMVAEVLAAHLGEHAVERTPPMFYPEAIQTAIHKRVNEVRDGLVAELAAARERTRELEEAQGRALWLLERIITDLPTKRDWLDPHVERLARDLLAAPTAAHTGGGRGAWRLKP